VQDVAFGYSAEKPLFRGVNFGIDCDSRIAIVGPNGVGASGFGIRTMSKTWLIRQGNGYSTPPLPWG
jgi:ATPase subunit of ABC transporter with duplicated ATPase domains